MKVLFSFMFILLLLSCSKDDDDNTNNPDPNENPEVNFVFEDGFETTGNDLMELFPEDGSRWSNLQLVDSDNGSNEISIATDVTNEGNNSLRILALATDGTLSKADIEKGGLYAPEGSTVSISASFYISSTENIENLLLIDLESCSCWDPTVPDNQCPGIRLMMKDNDHLSIERGKILNSTLVQTQVAFPRNEWVDVTWEMTLSQENTGMNSLYINGQEVISESGTNMPNAGEFEVEFAEYGIDFELQEPLFYERFQIGATANPTEHDIEMFVDNVRFEVIE